MASKHGISGRFGKILLGVNALATLGFGAALAQGYEFTAFYDPEALERHLQWALIATLVMFFAHSWVFIYLVSLRRELQRWVENRDGRGFRAPTFWAAGALLLVLGVFLLGPAVLVASVPPWVHGAAAYCAVAVQVLALIFEYRALVRSERLLAVWAAEAF